MVLDGRFNGCWCVLNADYGILPSPRPSCLQEVLDVLMGVFDRFIQQKNVRKMVEMVCHPCYMDIRHLEAA